MLLHALAQKAFQKFAVLVDAALLIIIIYSVFLLYAKKQ